MRLSSGWRLIRAFLPMAAVTLQAAAVYDIQFIDLPGAVQVVPQSLNNAGKVTGFYRDGTSPGTRGFLWSTSGSSLLDYPGATSTLPTGINDLGQVVGSVSVPNGSAPATSFGFLYSGTFSPFAILGAESFGASGINDAGTIVGSYRFAGEIYSYSLSGGVYTLVSVPGASNTFAIDINNKGQIVGIQEVPIRAQRGFLFSAGAYSEILPGGYFSSALFGINNLGQMVGSGRSSRTASVQGLIFDGVSFQPFLLPGFDLVELFDINDKGQLIGSAWSGLNAKAFLATPKTAPPPVPEPSTMAGGLVACGLLALATFAKKKRKAAGAGARLGLVLIAALAGSGPLAAQYGPLVKETTFSNAPGMITVYWEHRNTSVDYYFLQHRRVDQPAAITTNPQRFGPDSTQGTIGSLTPATNYEVRVCAYYSPEVECSYEDDARWFPVRTMDPERPGAPPRTAPVPAPPPVPAPALTAVVTRERDNGPVVVALRNINLRDLAPGERAQVVKQTWWRGEEPIGEGWNELLFDRNPPSWTTYRLCLELSNGQRACGAARGGYLGSAVTLRNVGFDSYVSHLNGSGFVNLPNQGRNPDPNSVAFLLRPGLAAVAGGVTFEVIGMPGHFLVGPGPVRVSKGDGNPDFDRRATYQVILPARGFAGQNSIFHLESVFRRGHYLFAGLTALVDGPFPNGSGGVPGTAAAFQFVPALAQPAGTQVRNTAMTRLRDTPMPTMNRPRKRLGKGAVGPSTEPVSTDPCVRLENARAYGALPIVITVLEARCRESRSKP